MTKTKVLWAGAVLTGIFILAKTPLVFTLFALIMLGIIPGTSLVIPAWVSLIVYPILIASVIIWLRSKPFMKTNQNTVRYQPPKRRAKKTATKRKSTAKRRSQATA